MSSSGNISFFLWLAFASIMWIQFGKKYCFCFPFFRGFYGAQANCSFWKDTISFPHCLFPVSTSPGRSQLCPFPHKGGKRQQAKHGPLPRERELCQGKGIPIPYKVLRTCSISIVCRAAAAGDVTVKACLRAWYPPSTFSAIFLICFIGSSGWFQQLKNCPDPPLVF